MVQINSLCYTLQVINIATLGHSVDNLVDCIKLFQDQLAVCCCISSVLPSGLQDLSVSGNCGISSFAWSKFFVDMSACNKLRSLSLDYNKIGDYGMGCLACALVHCRHLQTLDLEGCDINECGAEVSLKVV